MPISSVLPRRHWLQRGESVGTTNSEHSEEHDMNLSLTSLVPPLVWVGVAISGLAIGLGRQAPPSPVPEVRHAAVPLYQGVNGRVFSDREYQPNLIERATGRMVRVEVSA